MTPGKRQHTGTTAATAAPRRVMMLGYDGVQILDVTGPLEIIASANELGLSPAPYQVELIGERKGLMPTTMGMPLVAARGFAGVSDDELRALHTFMVSGGNGTERVMRDRAFMAFVARAVRLAPRVASVCSGAAILAATGALDGRRATTHWGVAPVMVRAFPKVRIEPDAIYVRDGKFWTSAGITAGMDLALALVEEDLGHDIALRIARRHVLYMMRPGGQAQFSAELAAQAVPKGKSARALSHIHENLSGDLSLPALAQACGMSPRSLQRAFLAEHGVSPASYVARARLDAARRKLSERTAKIERVAAQCGFASGEVLRRHFHRALGVSPSDYRARFLTTQRRHDS